jgi:hypothetical protein
MRASEPALVVDTEVDDRHLRRFVVRVETPDGVTRGSGVLVAPGWVLTCAHVVEGLESVRVVPDRGAAGAPGGSPPPFVGALVRARSATPDGTSGSVFWRFPDLALLELEGWSEHVCAPLVAAEPARGSEPHAWGYGRREPGVAAVGSPASFSYVGVEGDGYLSLKAGDATPGCSGAPLVCPRRRGVVGLMSVSRDPRDDRGGWASPTAALGGAAGVSEELAMLGGEILAMNRQVAWRYRDDWLGVLPVPGAEHLVDRPWDGAVVRPASGQPSMMLRA